MGRYIRTRVNRQIRIPEIRVIDSEGEQLGVMPTPQALAMAEEQGLDLVEISPTSRPPVCRIMDYGKYKYELNKRQKESKKKQHVIQVKEIKLRPKTEEHDYNFKIRHARAFLEKNNKVKFTVIFRGRELSHKELGYRILDRVKEALADVASVEKAAGFEGRLMVMIMAPGETKEKQEKKERKPAPRKDDKAGKSTEEGNDAKT